MKTRQSCAKVEVTSASLDPSRDRVWMIPRPPFQFQALGHHPKLYKSLLGQHTMRAGAKQDRLCNKRLREAIEQVLIARHVGNIQEEFTWSSYELRPTQIDPMSAK